MLWFGTNWKMNKTRVETRSCVTELATFVRTLPRGRVQAFIIPPATSIAVAAEGLQGTGALVGIQNIHWEKNGAYTGETSAEMAAECGARIAAIGHSERRRLFGESDDGVNRKVHAALRADLIALVCVGEDEFEKQRGTEEEYVERQVKVALHGVVGDSMLNVWIAYEPAWAIGIGGTPAEPDYAERMHGVIRKTIDALYGREMAERTPVIYGGSVTHENALEYVRRGGVDGLFVGRTALDVHSFASLIESCLAAKKG